MKGSPNYVLYYIILMSYKKKNREANIRYLHKHGENFIHNFSGFDLGGFLNLMQDQLAVTYL